MVSKSRPFFLFPLSLCLFLKAFSSEAEDFESFQRGLDLEAWTVLDPGGDGHASLLRPETEVWSYWTAPAGVEWNDPDEWIPLPHAGPGEYRDRVGGPAGEHRYFRLHDYYVDADGFGLYWNRHPDLEPGALTNRRLLVVFTAPVAGTYRLDGDFLWRHWPGPGMNDGRIEVWRMDGKRLEAELAFAPLVAAARSEEFSAVPWVESPSGKEVELEAGDRIVIRLVGSRSQYRGVEIREDGFRIERTGCTPPVAMPADPLLAVRTRQLQTLLDPDVPGLRGFHRAAEEGRFADALGEFQSAFLQLAATLRPVNLPSQWLFNPTSAEDVREGRIKTLAYGGSETFVFDIGAPGEVPWDTLGKERYPLLLRDLSTMHWVAALADTDNGGGAPGDAALWFGYWADLAERWTAQYAVMAQDPEMIELLPRQSIKWPGSAPLYFGWRLGNFFSWLPVVGEQLAGGDAERPDPLDLATVLVWFAADEIPASTRVLANPRGVPNQRRLLAAGLLQAGASMQWFRGIEAAVDGAKEFLREMALVEMLPDGGSLEYSLNYNKALPHEIDNYLAMNANLPENWQFPTAMIAFLERASAYRYALIEAILRPNGTPPTIGKNNPYVFFDPWPESMNEYPLSQALQNAFEGDASGLGFTSVYFPWTGYVALRDDWSEEAAYALFQNNRPGIGHHRESALRLDISAFGAELLVNSGAEQYSNKGNFNAYFNSTASQNSISVDGYSQLTQSRELDLPYQTPIRARWFTSDAVDFVEGIYDGPYGGWNFTEHGSATERKVDWEKEPVLDDVHHRRRVLFLRELPAWVVVDEVRSGSSRTFTQTWNFAPEFGEDAVRLDEEAGQVRAVQGDAPSVELLQIADPDLSPGYAVYRGIHEPDRILGWVSKDRAPKAYDFAAANDLHVEWQSEGFRWIVTVIVPSPDGEARIVDVSSDEGSRTIRLGSGHTLAIACGEMTGESLDLTITLEEDREDSGETTPSAPLEVRMESDRVTFAGPFEETREAFLPTGFFWKQKADGTWIPVYDAPGPDGF